MLRRRGRSAEAKTEDRCSIAGAEKAAGAPRRGGGARPGSGLVYCSCGMRATWASGPLCALPLRPSRCSRAAGLGGARPSSGGGASFVGGNSLVLDHRKVGPGLTFAFFSRPKCSEDNLALALSPPDSLTASHPHVPDLFVPPSDSTSWKGWGGG